MRDPPKHVQKREDEQSSWLLCHCPYESGRRRRCGDAEWLIMLLDDPGKGHRWTLYLSGGGFRAALGAIGGLFYLWEHNAWPAVKRIVSVSGGGLLNAWLATRRPNDEALPKELAALFRMLTSRRTIVFVTLLVALFAGLIFGSSAVILANTAGVALRVVLITVTGLAWLSVLLHLGTRLWLHVLLTQFVGRVRLDDARGTAWNREHIFAATDFGGSGSYFFLMNRLQPQAFSWNRGKTDARAVPLSKALRATTASPPLLPPTGYSPRNRKAETKCATAQTTNGFGIPRGRQVGYGLQMGASLETWEFNSICTPLRKIPPVCTRSIRVSVPEPDRRMLTVHCIKAISFGSARRVSHAVSSSIRRVVPFLLRELQPRCFGFPYLGPSSTQCEPCS